MKFVLKRILLFAVSLKYYRKLLISKIFGDYVLNNFIETCSERHLVYFLNKLGATIAPTCNIRQGLVFDNTYFKYSNLKVSDNVYIGRKVFLDMVDYIYIEKDAVISEGVSILTHQDVGERMLSQYYKRKTGSVTLREGSFIGSNATILCGVVIGKCSVVAAGSVVINNVPDFTVVGGVPAKHIKNIKK
jgi:acetyltransferase-like isoleucine patch superfamily enzyme